MRQDGKAVGCVDPLAVSQLGGRDIALRQRGQRRPGHGLIGAAVEIGTGEAAMGSAFPFDVERCEPFRAAPVWSATTATESLSGAAFRYDRRADCGGIDARFIVVLLTRGSASGFRLQVSRLIC
jgi:hypothetical protein